MSTLQLTSCDCGADPFQFVWSPGITCPFRVWHRTIAPPPHHHHHTATTGRSQADDYLQDRPEGTFLLRISEHAEGYALDFKHDGRVRHFKMLFDKLGQYQVQNNDESFSSLLELVTHVYPLLPPPPRPYIFLFFYFFRYW